MTDISWNQGVWSHQPAGVAADGNDLLVTAEEGSDAWRLTSYGFVHDSEHALLAPFPMSSAMEVEFTASFAEQFDQAGLFIRSSRTRWIKAGVEFADGSAQLGAVVTDAMSDWSLSPVPGWVGARVVVRASRQGNAITIRAGLVGEELHLVRVAPFPADVDAEAGPFVCAPTRSGLVVPLHAWRRTDSDKALH